MNADKLLFGAAYYDEYLPEDRIETDMEMIKRAGMNVIRIAESTWSTWEVQDGVYDFTHLHRMLTCSKKHGIQVIVGTPTYAVPTWLVRKYPDILTETHEGQERYGRRQNMDIAHPMYLKHAERIIRRLMEEVQQYDHVIGFQLDNETKSYDTCSPYAQKKFIAYIRELFHDDLPHGLTEVFGMTYDQFTDAVNVGLKNNTTHTVTTSSDTDSHSNCVHHWMELLIPNQAETLAFLCEKADISMESAVYPVVIKRGTNDLHKEITYYFNYSAETVQAAYHGPYARVLLGRKESEQTVKDGDPLTLSRWDFIILEEV